MPRVPFATAILCKDELQRYLPEVLNWHAAFGPIVVLDDNSTDGTYEYCREHPAVIQCVRRETTTAAWGSEAPARQQLWELAASVSEWHLVCDADQILSADPRPLIAAQNLNAWAFPLYDLWGERNTYREDKFWRGHLHPRPWLFNPHRVPDGYVPQWSGRGIHTGHYPLNFPINASVAPKDFYWLHLAYLDPVHRDAKLTRYRSQYHQMSDMEQAHAESIVDPTPSLKVLPFAKPVRVLCGGPVRKSAVILQAHLDSLAAQELPPRVQVDYLFVDDYPDPDPAQQILADFCAAHNGRIIKNTSQVPGDFTDQHPVCHQWSETAMNRVGQLKHQLMKACVDERYNYLWLVDSDLILDRTTLMSLLSAEQLVTAAVYWTRWNTDPKIHAGPQVWHRPVYQMGLPYYPTAEFRQNLAVKRTLEAVGGLGACTLIRRDVIEKGVNFTKPPGFPSGGLWDGEDRHFCEWARRLHVTLFADAWPDIFHCYHPSDLERLPVMAARMNDGHPMYPNVGHLVSLKLTNIEEGVGPFIVRCRIGDNTLLPELESTVMQMQRGDEKMVRIHFPSTMPSFANMNLAGQNRLLQVKLIDVKPFGLAPVVEDEFYISTQGTSVQDRTTLTAEQHQLMGAAQ